MNELLKSGAILHDTYRILRVIDQGGMGAIYMAENRQLFDETCAVKEMLDNFSSPEEQKESLQLFEQEAKILYRLNHPNLPRVQAYFSENSHYYLVMDYIKGRTLENIVESASDYIPESAVLRWCADLCNILEYLHSQNPPIIFRDMNPRNIMLEEGTGHIKLIDFGIARLFKAGKSSDTLSLGSPGYCPIEQYGRGQTDVRSDVYTLGATLYHLLTKKVPVPAVERIKPTPVLLTLPRQINRRISNNMEQVIVKAMEINPDDRYKSIMEMRHALFPQHATQRTSTQATGAATKKTGVETSSGTQQQSPSQSGPQTGQQQSRKQPPSQPPPQKKQTGQPTGTVKPRRRGTPKLAWFVLLFVASMSIAEWVEGWQNRGSGNDATPRGAKTLGIPGTESDRVSFLTGDRTDWWQLKTAQSGTLTVVITPQSKPDGIRLTIFDRNGQSILKRGVARDGYVEAVLPVTPRTRVFAQVLAPRIWDDTRYTIEVTNTDVEDLPLITSPGIDVDPSPSISEPATLDIPNYATPDVAHILQPNTKTRGQIHVNDGLGVTWWRITPPTTGFMSIAVNTENSIAPEAEVYDAQEQLLPASGDTHDGLVVTVLGSEDYLVRLFTEEGTTHIPYTITAQFRDDHDIFSGPDRVPDGANDLPFRGNIQDAVSYTRGDRTDWWRLKFPASGTISLKLEADSPESIHIQVYEASVIRHQQTSDEITALSEMHGNEQVNVDGNTGTVYYVAVEALQTADAGAYAIHTDFMLDPEANSGPDAEPSGARTLSVNGGARGSVDYTRGDRTDWWRISVQGPGELTIALNGRGDTADLQLDLYDDQGEKLLKTSRTPGSSREELSFELTDRGSYLIRVYAEARDDAGNYQLTSWYTIAPDASSGLDRAATGAKELRFGRPSRDSVDYNEGDRTDWWKVWVPGAGTLTVEIEVETYLANLEMNVYEDPDSTALASSQTLRSSREQISITTDREIWCYLKVFALESDDESKYTLTASFTLQ